MKKVLLPLCIFSLAGTLYAGSGCGSSCGKKTEDKTTDKAEEVVAQGADSKECDAKKDCGSKKKCGGSATTDEA